MNTLQRMADRGSVAPSGIGPARAARDHPALVRGRWDRKTRALFWILLVAAGLLAVPVYAGIITLTATRGGSYVNSVFLFWGWSKFIHVVSPASAIYVPHLLYAFEHGIVGMPRSPMPFAYPPSLLLLIWPLALVAPVTAWALWLGASLAVYVWACWQRPWGVSAAALGLVAPSTVAAVYAAQTSLLAAALMIGGCRLLGRRPVLAGVLFGLLTVKPQYGMLVPVALVSARQWRSVMAATATAALLVLSSGAVFGWTAWTRLPMALAALARLVARFRVFDQYSITVTSGLRLLGAGPMVTTLGQVAAAAGTAVAVWFCFRRGVTPLGCAALMVGAFLVTPYAQYYDLPLVSYAVLLFVTDRHRGCRRFRGGELVVLVLVVALPFLVRVPSVPWGMIALGPLFGLIVRRIAILGSAAAAGGRVGS